MTLTYTKDVTADFTVKFENGKLTETPKADKAATYAGKQTKTRFTASLPTDKADSELTKQGQTYTWNNQVQSFEKLTPPAAGYYSRRINGQHRVVYTIDKVTKIVEIYSCWAHYESGNLEMSGKSNSRKN